MRDRDFESLGNVFKRPEFRELFERVFRGDGRGVDPDWSEPAINCARCNDTGFLARNVPPTDPEFGRPLECPCGIVATRRRMKIWRASQIPPTMLEYTLDSYAALTGNTALASDLRAWQETGDDALFLGPVGVGKTGLAVALLLEAMRASRTGLYVVAPSFLSRIRATYGRDGDVDETDVLESVVGVNDLVLDDLGKVKLTDWGQEKLFTVVNERYLYGRRTIYTSNLDLAGLEEHLWPATFDRIRARSSIFTLSGDSLR
jgi:DNA replication protein DnaC